MSVREKYSFYLDFGAAGNVFSFKGPKGKKGQLIDYGVEGITEAFVATASVAVGLAGNADAYGEELLMGSSAPDTVGTLSAKTEATDPDDFRATYVVEPDIPADTAIYITCVADSTSGMANAFAVVEWQD